MPSDSGPRRRESAPAPAGGTVGRCVDVTAGVPAPASPGVRSRARRGTALILALALAWSPAAGLRAADGGGYASNLPALGDSASEELSPLAERRLGEEIMRQIRANSDDLDDPDTVEYLNRFGEQLASHAPAGSPGFEFFAVKDPSINAFALPGGFIGVHTGLLLSSQSESELAGVIGHEMGHVTQRHIARSLAAQREASYGTLALLALAILAGRAGNGQVAQAAAAGGVGFAAQNQLAFSREAEREADRVGVQFLEDSGFDVTGMVDFFGRLQQANRFYERAAPAYLRTHPLTTERIADIQGRVREARYRQRLDSPEFQLVRARLRVIQDDTAQGWREARIAFGEQLRNGTTALRPAAHYGLALLALRQRDYPVARRELDGARADLRARSPMLDKLAVEIASQSGDKAGAIELARAARNQFPQSRMLAVGYAEALQQAERHDEAIAFLRDQINLYRQEPNLYSMIAKSYAARANDLQTHKALAESFYLRGNLRGAVDQLQMARRSRAAADFYEASQIDARTREIQRLLQERERGAREGGQR